MRQPVFELRQIAIAGPLSRVNPAHLEAVVREELRGTFFTMQLAEARSSLQRVPWVRGIALRRQWPNRLDVFVTEHTPLARWNDNALVNKEGEVFVADYDGELPQFTGPEGSAGEMRARFAVFGDHDLLARWQEKALEDPAFAKANGDGARARVALYRGNKPYRE